MFFSFYILRLNISVDRFPGTIDVFVAIEDYVDEMNNLCLRKDELVVVLDRASHPGMWYVVKLRPDGSKGDEIWVPAKILRRRKSTDAITLAPGKDLLTLKTLKIRGKFSWGIIRIYEQYSVEKLAQGPKYEGMSNMVDIREINIQVVLLSCKLS